MSEAEPRDNLPSAPPAPTERGDGDEGQGASEQQMVALVAPASWARRVWRIVKWMLIVTLLLLLLTVGLLFLALANLEHPLIAGWIKDTVADYTGISIDYAELSVAPFSGIEGEHLVVFTPEPYAQYAPELAHLDKLSVSWDFWPLVRGRPDIERVYLRGLTVTIVIDEHGDTSLSALGGSSSSSSSAPEPPKPDESAPDYLSDALRKAIPDVAVESIAIEQITARLIWVEAGAIVRRHTLTNLCVASDVAGSSGKLDARLRVEACPESEGVLFAVEDQLQASQARERQLVASLLVDAHTPTAGSVEMTLSSQLVRQNLLRPDGLPERLLTGKLGVAFEPADRRVRLYIDQLDALSGGLTADVRGQLRDRDDGSIAPVFARAQGGMDLAPLQGLIELLVAPEFEEFAVPAGTVTYQIDELTVDPDTGTVAARDLQMKAQLPEARINSDGQLLTLTDGAFDLAGQLGESGPGNPGESGVSDSARARSITATARMAAATVDDRSLNERIALTEVDAKLTGTDVALNADDPLASRGGMDIAGRVATIESDLDGQLTDIRGATITGHFDSGEFIKGTGEMPMVSLSYIDPSSDDLRVEAEQAVLTWDIQRMDADWSRPAQARATLRMASADVRDGYQRTRLTEPRAEVDALIRDESHFDADIDLPVSALSVQTTDGIAIKARSARFGLTVNDFELSDDDVLRSVGQVAWRSDMGRASVVIDELRADARRLGFTMDTTLDGSDALTVRGRMPVGWLETRDSGERLARIERGALRYQLDGFVLNDSDALLSRGRIKISGGLPALILPGTDKEPEVALEIPSLLADLTMGGTRRKYRANMRVKLDSYVTEGRRKPADVVIVASTDADLRLPKIDSDLTVRGPDGPEIKADLNAHYKRGQRDFSYDMTLLAERLAIIGEILPPAVKEEHQIDWAALRIDGRGSGNLRDVVKSFGGGFGKEVTDVFEPQLVADPVGKLRGSQNLALDITGFDYRGEDQALAAPELIVRFKAEEKAGPLTVDIDVDAKSARVEMDGEVYAVTGLEQRLDLSSTGAPERGRVNLAWRTKVASARQDLIGYPVSDAKFVANGYLDKLSSLRVVEFSFDNKAGGTLVKAGLALDRLPTGNVSNASVIPGRQALTMTGVWHQELAPVRLGEDAPEMRGRVSLPFRIESGDLSAFLIKAQAKMNNVFVAMPDEDIEVAGLSGDVPLVADIALLPDGTVQLLSGPGANLYSRTRFLDVHPFLHDDHYLTVDRVTYAGEKLGPIAGNLRIERDTIALDQLEMGYRGGSVTGQVLVDYQGGKPSMQFRGTVTGIRPRKGGGQLDANAALSFVPSKLALEGRMQIVRLDKRHLREILDILDPYRQDADFNKIRLALKVGYPKYVRLRMQDGFMSVSIKLGGVSRIVRLGQLRGIALEPLLQLYVVPYLPEGTIE